MGVQLGPRHCVDEGPRVRRGLRSPVVVRSLLTDDSVPVAIAHASVRRVRPPDRRPVAWQTPRPGALGPSPSCCRTTCAPPRPARIDAHEFISSRCPDVRADSSQRRCPPTPSSPEFHSLYGHSASCRVTPRWSSGRTGQGQSSAAATDHHHRVQQLPRRTAGPPRNSAISRFLDFGRPQSLFPQADLRRYCYQPPSARTSPRCSYLRPALSSAAFGMLTVGSRTSIYRPSASNHIPFRAGESTVGSTSRSTDSPNRADMSF